MLDISFCLHFRGSENAGHGYLLAQSLPPA